MGLDMYMYSADAKTVQIDELKVVSPIGEAEATLVGQWRNHHSMNRWMEQLYASRGGKDEFNQVDILITEDTLHDLKIAVLQDAFKRENVSLDHVNFQKTQDLKFIQDAFSEIKRGKIVFYSSWW